MRYKWFTWPHNPRVYSIDYRRAMAVNKVPQPQGLYFLQDLGREQRVMEGEGEFVGEEAYHQFGQLANTFYESGPGLLIHPLWQSANAYFVSLRLEQEPRRDYVRYSFTFWEDERIYSDQARVVSAPSTGAPSGQSSPSGQTPVYHRVVRGDTLWAIARDYGLSLEALIALNPQIKNPNLIRVGDEVRVQ